MTKYREKLLQEIQEAMGAKLFSIQRGIASEREKQIVKECLGYVSLLNHSALTSREFYRLWEKSGLSYQ
jgi:hypothetical protein